MACHDFGCEFTRSRVLANAGGLKKARDIWQRWSGAYVAFALTLFIYLMSRSLLYPTLTAVLHFFDGMFSWRVVDSSSLWPLPLLAR